MCAERASGQRRRREGRRSRGDQEGGRRRGFGRRGLWLSYLFVLFYLAVAAGAVTHADLFFEKPVKLPFLNIELPLLAFFFLAPILFIVIHAYTLVHLVFLTDKAKRFHQALHDPKRTRRRDSRNLQWQLPSNIFVQLLAGSEPTNVHERRFRRLLWCIAWIPLAVAPVLLLLLVQVQFLPFHSLFITWAQRLALLVDLWLIWWLWGKVRSGREIDSARRKWVPRIWSAAKFAPILAVILFAGTVATFSGEWQEVIHRACKSSPLQPNGRVSSRFAIGSLIQKSCLSMIGSSTRLSIPRPAAVCFPSQTHSCSQASTSLKVLASMNPRSRSGGTSSISLAAAI